MLDLKRAKLRFRFSELKFRSAPYDPPDLSRVQAKPLTEEQLEYLEFFTTYCKHTDNVQDYGIGVEERDRIKSIYSMPDDNMSLSRSLSL